jgi:hypothetical protein
MATPGSPVPQVVAPAFTTSDWMDQYKAYLADLGNVGSRYATANGFYLSIISALLGVLAPDGVGQDFRYRRRFSIGALDRMPVCQRRMRRVDQDVGLLREAVFREIPGAQSAREPSAIPVL